MMSSGDQPDSTPVDKGALTAESQTSCHPVLHLLLHVVQSASGSHLASPEASGPVP